MISDPPEVIVHEATNNTDDIVYTLQQVEKIEAGFQYSTFCNKYFLKMCNTFYARNAKKRSFFVAHIGEMQHFCCKHC